MLDLWSNMVEHFTTRELSIAGDRPMASKLDEAEGGGVEGFDEEWRQRHFIRES
jgi:hypothetical protein